MPSRRAPNCGPRPTGELLKLYHSVLKTIPSDESAMTTSNDRRSFAQVQLVSTLRKTSSLIRPSLRSRTAVRRSIRTSSRFSSWCARVMRRIAVTLAALPGQRCQSLAIMLLDVIIDVGKLWAILRSSS